MFSVSEYFDRMEKVSLEILETMEPIDKTITLWWGFDGIQLSEDGTSKWVSRRKKLVENQVHHPFQPILPEAFRYGFKGADRCVDGAMHSAANAIMEKCASSKQTPAVLRTVSSVLLWRMLRELYWIDF